MHNITNNISDQLQSVYIEIILITVFGDFHC